MAEPTSFLDLPPELRMEIYSHLFTALTTEFVKPLNTQTEDTAENAPDGLPTLPRGLEIFPGIMRVNPLIREEARSLYQTYLTTLQQGFAQRAMKQEVGEWAMEHFMDLARTMRSLGVMVSTEDHRATADWHAAEKVKALAMEQRVATVLRSL
ncbi:hypothetical protein LTR56_019521 [Elasticomyces elasticus]|nr:hypothetical protein LTR56_019521 [Elasticomyces elasticus]KAK3653732.1 hypothetical protein LTR22_011110 [Elasticomyces elasticus]KAK4924160.1 hypothetical protein LTR49_008680 [Elasticomyces elasticus]KAK5758508.1 hypothetical protein LTS12_011371 [Elasticomyces elasticus]